MRTPRESSPTPLPRTTTASASPSCPCGAPPASTSRRRSRSTMDPSRSRGSLPRRRAAVMDLVVEWNPQRRRSPCARHVRPPLRAQGPALPRVSAAAASPAFSGASNGAVAASSTYAPAATVPRATLLPPASRGSHRVAPPRRLRGSELGRRGRLLRHPHLCLPPLWSPPRHWPPRRCPRCSARALASQHRHGRRLPHLHPISMKSAELKFGSLEWRAHVESSSYTSFQVRDSYTSIKEGVLIYMLYCKITRMNCFISRSALCFRL